MSDSYCKGCRDEHYILIGCCSGARNECGCMGVPVAIKNCIQCNPNADKPHGETIAEYIDHVEFIKV